jgi:hypothetical protein
LRAVGIAVKHLDINVAYSNFAFPKSIAPQVFVTPTPSKTAHLGKASVPRRYVVPVNSGDP